MDLKVTNLAQIQQQNALSNLPETDGSFRFALLSNLQENELQSQLALDRKSTRLNSSHAR